MIKLISWSARTLVKLSVKQPALIKQNVQFTHCSRLFCTATTSPDIASITKGDSDLEHKLKVLILEVDVMRQEGRLVPDETYIHNKHWEELLKLQTVSARRRYLEFLFKISKKKENRQLKKEQKRQEREVTKPERKQDETFEDFVHTYDLSHNNIFLRFYETTMNEMYNNRLIQAMQFGQKLIVDCGYGQQMTKRENVNCAKQLMLLFAENRAHDDPFDLHYCNFDRSGVMEQALNGFIATMHEPWFPLNIHPCNYTDIFPKDQLVYLTPHCREELLEYDHNAIYIIGGIVDKINNDPLSLAKAKREGIRMAKFPLDRYLQWGAGSGKSLTINQSASILLDVKHTNDWKFALRHVPRRKIIEEISTGQRDKRAMWKPRDPNQKYSLKSTTRQTIKSIFHDDEESDAETSRKIYKSRK